MKRKHSSLSLLIPLIFIVATGFITVAAPLPVLPLYVHAFISSNTFFIGTIVGLQSISTILSRRFAGNLADERGPKYAVILGLTTCSIAAVFSMFAGFDGCGVAASIVLLAGGRIALGIGESFLLTGAITWGIARIGTENSGKVMSWNGIAMYAALAAGAPLGSFIFQSAGAGRPGFIALFMGAALAPIPALILAWRLPSVKTMSIRPASTADVLRVIWPLGLVLTLQMVGFGTISSFLSLVFLSRHWVGAGLAFTGFGIGVIATRIIFGGYPDRLGGMRVAAACLAIELCGQAILMLAWTPAVAIIGCIVTGIGCALAFPALGVEAIKRVTAENRGIVIGLFSAFQDIAFGMTGPIAGVLAGLSGFASIFGLGAAASGAGLIILYGQNRSMNYGTQNRDHRFRPDGQATV